MVDWYLRAWRRLFELQSELKSSIMLNIILISSEYENICLLSPHRARHMWREMFLSDGEFPSAVSIKFILWIKIRMTEQALLDQTTELTCWPLTYRVTVLYPDPPLCNLYSRQCCRYEILLLDKSCLLHHKPPTNPEPNTKLLVSCFSFLPGVCWCHSPTQSHNIQSRPIRIPKKHEMAPDWFS